MKRIFTLVILGLSLQAFAQETTSRIGQYNCGSSVGDNLSDLNPGKDLDDVKEVCQRCGYTYDGNNNLEEINSLVPDVNGEGRRS